MEFLGENFRFTHDNMNVPFLSRTLLAELGVVIDLNSTGGGRGEGGGGTEVTSVLILYLYVGK